MKLLTAGNPKTLKGESAGYLTAILHLAPSTLAGCGDVCPWASPACRAACLNTAGRGGIIRKGEHTNAIQEARKRRTRMFMEDRVAFLRELELDIAAHVTKAKRLGLKPAVRLNGTSDIPWERVAPELFDYWHGVQFYDYTKSPERMQCQLDADRWPSNYSLTFSRSETNDERCRDLLDVANVAVVFDVLPREWHGVPVVDGDQTDLRFLDPTGVVVGLKAKGKARKDQSGFVVRGAHILGGAL